MEPTRSAKKARRRESAGNTRNKRDREGEWRIRPEAIRFGTAGHGIGGLGSVRSLPTRTPNPDFLWGFKLVPPTLTRPPSRDDA